MAGFERQVLRRALVDQNDNIIAVKQVSDNTISDDDWILCHQSFIIGQKPDGTFDKVRLSQDKSLYIHNDPHESPNISVHMSEESGITDTLAVAASKNDQIITVNNGDAWSVGNKIQIPNEYDILTIKVISGNDLTLDRQLDISHAIGDSIAGVNVNMAVNGSVTPRIFKYTPPTDKLIHIHTINIIFQSSTEPGLHKFGGIDELTYGIHFRVKNTTGRDNTYWIPFRSMNSMRLSNFIYEKEAKVGTNWFCHLSINLTLNDNVIISLDERKGQYFECIVQDDNTGNISTEIKLSIHEESQSD